jgi:hypothetical protein
MELHHLQGWQSSLPRQKERFCSCETHQEQTVRNQRLQMRNSQGITNYMQFSKIYSANGKPIFPRNGMTIPVGSLVLTIKNEFVTLDKDHKYLKKIEWNNMCQSKEIEETLIPVIM